jgi:periplasmic protein TonB
VKNITTLALLLSAFATTPALSADAPTSWQGAVARLIAGKQSYPRSAQIRGEEGTTRLRIALNPDGKVNQVELAASSGSAILDREAQSVVSAIGKFPPPPAGTRTLLVPIVWRLN